MYEDEAVFYQSGSATRTWARIGVGTIVHSFPCRNTQKAFGAVSTGKSPRWHFMFSDVFNGDTFIDFLKQVVRNNPGRKIHMVVDNAKYHKASLVKEWLEENSKDIQLHYLPPYSPELNATEKVWKLTKQKAVHNRYFHTNHMLRKAVLRRFNRFQGNPASLRGILAPYS